MILYYNKINSIKSFFKKTILFILIVLINNILTNFIQGGIRIKILITILKVLLLFFTSIWGLALNLLGAYGLIVFTKAPALGAALIITTILGYIIPTILIMLNRTKLAPILSCVASLALIFIGAGFSNLELVNSITFYRNHLPSIAITILIVLISLFSNLNEIKEFLRKREEKENEVAPSIFSKLN